MSRFDPRIWLSVLIVGAGAASTARAGGVRILDRPGLASFGTIQAAVDAAIDGEVLLVGGGTYSAFTVVNKSVAVVAAPNASVVIQGTVEIDDLGPARTVVLIGLDVTGAAQTSPLQSDPALRLLHDLGHVRVDNCTLRGGAGSGVATGNLYGSGGPGCVAIDSRRTVFSRCNVFGGNGAFNNSSNYESNGGDGGRAIDAAQSTVMLYDSSLTGGKGGNGGTSGGEGGDAYHALDFGVVASGSTFTGGKGGDGWDFLYNQAGNGGDALFVDAAAQAQLLDNVYAGGAAGASFGNLGPAVAGATIGGTGVVAQHAGHARHLSANPVADDETLWNVVVTGQPGDRVTLAYSSQPAFAVPTPVNGMQLVPASSATIKSTVKMPISGVLAMSIRVPRIGGANPERFGFWQGWLDEANGTRWLSSPLHRVALDRRGLPDCNGNGQIDVLDVVQGLSADVDRDLVPDPCDPDCNSNGVIDGLDVANGTSADLDHDLVPDSCESQHTWYVDDNAPQGGDGSLGAPVRALRAAIDLALPGDTVIAFDGVYTGADNRELDFKAKNLIVASANGPAACTIDCQGAGRAFYLHGNETLATRIEGFTIANGFAKPVSAGLSNQGGGILALAATPTVRNCVITNCVSEYLGGGLWLKGGRVEGCTVISNTARHPTLAYGIGGGLYCGGSVTVVATRFENNQALAGGGVAIGPVVAPGVALSRCAIVGNSAESTGGGVFDNSGGNSLVLIDQCAIAGNTADKGGGIAATSYLSNPASSVEIHNTTLAGNATVHQGGALYLSFQKHASLSNTIVWGNSAALGYQVRLDQPSGELSIDWCDVQGGLASINAGPATLFYGATNIALDPLFADGDYRIDDFSPCIDAGDNLSIALDRADSDGDGVINEPAPLDLDGLARRVDDPAVADTGNGGAPIVDIGAYEHVP